MPRTSTRMTIAAFAAGLAVLMAATSDTSSGAHKAASDKSGIDWYDRISSIPLTKH